MKNIFAFLGVFYLGISVQMLFAQCAFDPTITPENPILCYYETDTLWTQEYESYQWYKDGDPIPGATMQYLVVNGQEILNEYTVEATLDDCTEISPPVLVDGWAWLPLFVQTPEFTGGTNYWIDAMDPNNPTDDVFHICTDGVATFEFPPTAGWFDFHWINQNMEPVPGDTILKVTAGGEYFVCANLEICPLHEECIPFSLISAVDHETVIPEITQSGDTLTCTTGQSYQWFLDGDPIPGANTNTWIAQETGTYTVEVEDDNMCMGLADPVVVTIVSNRENFVTIQGLKIYPNPVESNLMIQFSEKATVSVDLEVYSVYGQLVMRYERLTGENHRLNMESLEKGFYTIKIISGQASSSVKVLKL